MGASMSETRLQRLLRAAEDARRMLEIYRQELIDSHCVPPESRSAENVQDAQVGADIAEHDRVLKRLRKAIERYEGEPGTRCKQCSAGGGQHYGNCPAATPATMIIGPAE